MRLKNLLVEKNVPTNPSKWDKWVGKAKEKFDVYPSAYANAWAAKMYKDDGGGWKNEGVEKVAVALPQTKELKGKKIGERFLEYLQDNGLKHAAYETQDGDVKIVGLNKDQVKEVLGKLVNEWNSKVKESVINERKYYVTYNKGRGRGKDLEMDTKTRKPMTFNSYKDAKEYAEKMEKMFQHSIGGGTAYWVSDEKMNRIEESINEGNWAKIMKGVRGGDLSGPWTIVVINKNTKKVVYQKPVKVKDAIPAFYEEVREKFRGPAFAIVIEDNGGQVVYKESLKKEGFGAVGTGVGLPDGSINGAPKSKDAAKMRAKLNAQKANETK